MLSTSEEYMNSTKAALTDMGICTTVNSNDIARTFNIDNYEQMQAFAEILDGQGVNTSSLHIVGSGFIHRSIFWLNVRNPNPSAVGPEYGANSVKGGISAAINNWNEHFSVRSGPVIGYLRQHNEYLYVYLFPDHNKFISRQASITT